jgi:hypothetical protein
LAAAHGTVGAVRGVLAFVAVLVVALAAAGVADASYIVDRNATGVTLRVSGTTAIVDYSTNGVHRHALLSGAINARQPNAGVPQVKFHVVYGGGNQPGGACRPYTGPALPLVVAACDGADGSHWVLQSWNRLQRDYGGTSAPWELHASHFTGDPAKLDVWLDWSYGGRYQHLFGRLTYGGQPVYGFRTTHAGAPLDGYGRNVYLDAYDSSYGSGWRRENSFVAHKSTGVFCYGFYPHAGRPGTGSAYRLTVQGPGVTPIVQWTGNALGGYDADLDAQMNALQRSLGDRLCRQN